MTILTWERFFPVSLHLRQGDALQGKAISLRRDDDCFTVTYDPEGASLDTAAVLARALLASEGITVSEVVLEGHAPDLTALYRAASKLLLDVEITSGSKITEPTVKVQSGPEPGDILRPGGLESVRRHLPAASCLRRRSAEGGPEPEAHRTGEEGLRRGGRPRPRCGGCSGAGERRPGRRLRGSAATVSRDPGRAADGRHDHLCSLSFHPERSRTQPCLATLATMRREQCRRVFPNSAEPRGECLASCSSSCVHRRSPQLGPQPYGPSPAGQNPYRRT